MRKQKREDSSGWNSLCQWWENKFPFTIKVIGSILIIVLGLAFSISSGCDCKAEKRETQAVSAVQLKYDCPRSKIKITDKRKLGKEYLYRMDVCGKDKIFQCSSVDNEGCTIKKCTELKKPRKVN